MPLRPPAGFISAFYDPLRNPNAPTIGTATGGDASASVAFTAPTNVGGSAISLYGARSTPDNVTATAASSPISVTGLSNGTPYTFAVWAINTYGPSAFSAASNSVTPAAPPPRGVFGGGNSAANGNVIDYITIDTTGNSTDFGDLTQTMGTLTAFASSTRGVFGGGSTPTTGTVINTISYVTIASVGNATDFGDLTVARSSLGGCSSATRGLFGSGSTTTSIAGRTNEIEYVTIASTGNATDFGDVTVARFALVGCSSPTRGVFGGGTTGSFQNIIDYVTIASTGDATDFGDLTQLVYALASCSSSTRGIFAGGYESTTGGQDTNVISYITIASTGNATDFGDLTVARRRLAGCSSSTRGVFAGGAGESNVMDYITIASPGNAADFGDLLVGRGELAGCSNGHGGL
jgi:hypothetical protein